MRKIAQSGVVLASLLTMAAVPTFADAHASRYRHHHHRTRACNTTTGTVVGAIGGGLLGNVVAGRRHRTAGTLIGAGAGAVAGHELARRNCR